MSLPALTADRLKSITPADTTPVPVELPRLGVTAHVRRLNGRGYQQYRADLQAAGEEDADLVTLAHALGDAAGARLFADWKQVPAEALAGYECVQLVTEFNRANGPGGAARGN